MEQVLHNSRLPELVVVAGVVEYFQEMGVVEEFSETPIRKFQTYHYG
jgi:hypothetical protein